MFIGSWLKSLFGGALPYAARLYTRENCGLCVEAANLLKHEGFQVEFVDIDQDSDLVERFGLEIPVVEIGGKIRFRGRINAVLLKRIIDRELKQPRRSDGEGP